MKFNLRIDFNLGWNESYPTLIDNETKKKRNLVFFLFLSFFSPIPNLMHFFFLTYLKSKLST